MGRAGNRFCSKRAKTLVAMCENEPSPTSSEVSAISSCFTMSPVPSWFNSIFEASDMAVALDNFPASKNVNSAKRKLSFSPTKGHTPRLTPCSIRTEVHECTPAPINIHSASVQSDVVEVSSIHPDISDGSQNNCIDVKIHDQDMGEHKKKVRRLQRYPSQKKIMAAKLALNSGKEHITAEGKLKRGRLLKPSCKETCKRCEKPKLSLRERQEINCEFWALQDHVVQWTFINKSVTCIAPKRKTCIPGAKGEKLSSRIYHFTVCGVPKIVCKTMFKSTLSICDSWIDSALSHFLNGEMTCDGRGRNKSRSLV